MNISLRATFDKTFTILTGLSVVVLTVILIAVLGPMVYRGTGAVLFTGTVEFRKMQRDLFGRGGGAALEAEIAETEEVRRQLRTMIADFRKGIDIDAMSDQVRKIHREYGQQLRYQGVPTDQYTERRSISREIRDKLEETFAIKDVQQIKANVAEVLAYAEDPRFQDGLVREYFTLASTFLRTAEKVNLDRHHEYAQAVRDVEGILFFSDGRPGLLGAGPDDPTPPLAMLRYGSTRWDQVQNLLHRLRFYEVWEAQGPGEPLVKVTRPRAELFTGTPLENLIPFVQDNIDGLLKPRFTFYWQFFIDDNVDSHYFGGIGPEILGTVLITILGMVFVVPLGVIAAAYIVECSSDNWVMRIIRMCINTLAGVPSIVFGLFGLAFFVLFLFPLLGFEQKPCILAASMTLAILTLPVMIRSSEEAIRTVPQSYKEGSLALGASRFRTFLTVTLPAALPGILTGVILSLSRIAGETAPILFTGAVSLGPTPKSIFDPTRTLSYGSYDMAVGDRLAMMVPHNQYGMVVTLIMLILVLNTMAVVLRSHVFKKLKGH